MMAQADAIIAFWDGQSKGTGRIIEITKRIGKTVYVYMMPSVRGSSTQRAGALLAPASFAG